jgi:hypothetical protein
LYPKWWLAFPRQKEKKVLLFFSWEMAGAPPCISWKRKNVFFHDGSKSRKPWAKKAGVVSLNSSSAATSTQPQPAWPIIRKGQLDKCMTNWRASPGVI